MFGLKEVFDYFLCSNCECLQILKFPQDMSNYYPSNYYSFSKPRNSFIEKFIKRLRDRYAFYKKGIIGKLIHDRYPDEGLQALSRLSLTQETKILEVGSGSGRRLLALKSLGFKNLTGIDPFLENEIKEDNLKITQDKLTDLNEKWDVIFFYHSFEHLADPIETLQAVSERLKKNGSCVISIPTLSSHAWNHYKENWVQLDAPRHFYLYSTKSLKLVAEKAGLNLENIVYDSTEFQFWGSEQYLQGIPLQSNRSYSVNPSASIFSRSQIKAYKGKAHLLNLQNQGDQATFYFKK